MSFIITSVELYNIKRYTRKVYDFSTGVQLILGPNGSGKSTIFEAIGWSLFDYLEYNKIGWIRHNQELAHVKVTLIDDENDDKYIFFRDTAQKYMVSRNGKTIAQGVADIKSLVTEMFNISGEHSKMFRDVIGVSQDNFSSQLGSTPAEKKRIFDPLLGIDKYDKMYINLGPIESEIKNKIIEKNGDKSFLMGSMSNMDSLKEEELKVQGEIDILNKKIIEFTPKAEKAVEDAKNMKDMEDAFRDLQTKKKEFETFTRRLEDIESASENRTKLENERDGLRVDAESQRELRDEISELSWSEGQLKTVDDKRIKLNKNYEYLRELIEINEQEYDTNIERVTEEAKELFELETKFNSLVQQKGTIEANISHLEEQKKIAGDGMCPIIKEPCPAKILPTINSKLDAQLNIQNKFYSEYVDIKNKCAVAKNASIQKEKLMVAKRDADEARAEIVDVVKNIDECVVEIDKLNVLVSRKPVLTKQFENLGSVLERFTELNGFLKHETVTDKDSTLKDISEIKDEVRKLEPLASNYDSKVHAEIISMKTFCVNEITEAKAYLNSKTYALQNTQKDIVKLNDISDKVKLIEDDIASVNQKLDVVMTARERLKLIPPELAKVLLSSINVTANKYLNEMMGPVSLEIDEKYEVYLTDDKGTRTYRGFSGGEKMLVSTAVRLAFLSEITSFRLLILDEPTAQLDENVKGSLSDTIENVKGLDQMFIISHSSVFLSCSDKVIHVQK